MNNILLAVAVLICAVAGLILVPSDCSNRARATIAHSIAIGDTCP